MYEHVDCVLSDINMNCCTVQVWVFLFLAWVREGRNRGRKRQRKFILIPSSLSYVCIEYKADKNPNVMDESDLDGLPIWA